MIKTDAQNEEQSILGACLINYEKVVPEMLLQLSEEDFCFEFHKKVFKAIQTLYNENQPINVVSVGNIIKKDNKDFSFSVLSALVKTCLSVEMFKEYIKRIKESSIKRYLIESLGSIIHATTDENVTLEQLIMKANKTIEDVNETFSGSIKSKTFLIKNTLSEYYKEIEKVCPQGTNTVSKIETGFYDIDMIIGGLLKGGLHYLGGRPGMGKTTIMFQMALNIAKKLGPVYCCCFETPFNELHEKILCIEGQFDGSKIKKGPIDEFLLLDISRTCGRVFNIPFYFSTRSMSTQHIMIEAQRIKGLKALFIDRIEIINEPGRMGEKEVHRLGRISQDLNRLAVEMDIPVVCLVQLSREAENVKGTGKNKHHRPTLRNLRDSGALEQDGKMVFFIHRESMFDDEDLDNENKAEFIISKNMFGETGKVDLIFSKELHFFQSSGDKYESYGEGNGRYN